MMLQKIKSLFNKEKEISTESGGMIIHDTNPREFLEAKEKNIEVTETETQEKIEDTQEIEDTTQASLPEENAESQPSTLAIQLFDPTQSRPAAISPSGKIITHSPFDPAVSSPQQKEIPKFENIETDTELWDAVETVIDARIRPMIQSHQGEIELVKIEDGLVTVRLTGTCVGCAMSTVTLKYGVKKDIVSALPQIKDVDAVFAY